MKCAMIFISALAIILLVSAQLSESLPVNTEVCNSNIYDCKDCCARNGFSRDISCIKSFFESVCVCMGSPEDDY